MNKNGINTRHRRALLSLLLAVMLAVTGAAAELDPEADIGEALEFDAEQAQAGEGLELDLPERFSRDAEDNSIDLTSDELILNTDPLETLADPAPRTVSAPADFEIDENGVLTAYKGAGGDVVLPEGVTSIGNSAFAGCSGLTSVTIPEGVTSIGGYAFNRCSSLTSVTIPEGVTSIGNCPFGRCDKLEAINVADSNPVYTSSDGILYTRDMKTLVQCPGAKMSVTIPEGVTSIEGLAFCVCSSLTSVTIPEGVTSIGGWAFSGCSRLTSVIIPASVTSIGNEAFRSCSHLTIYGVAGSYAETYANNNGIPFVPSAITPEPDSVSIAQGQAATVYAGQTLQLTAKIAPADVETALTWSSSKKSVATVNSKGLVKGVKKGTATITVKTGNGKKASIKITVPEAPTKVKLSKTKATVVVGGTLNLKARLSPTTARTALTWTSSNKKVATVSDEGVVKGIKKGTATVTVRTSNGKKATCKVTVPAAPTKVVFAKKSYSVKVGKTVALKAGLTPASAQTVLTFSTSDKKIATVTQKGVVKGVKKGTATITVKTANGKKATVKVTVK